MTRARACWAGGLRDGGGGFYFWDPPEMTGGHVTIFTDTETAALARARKARVMPPMGFPR